MLGYRALIPKTGWFFFYSHIYCSLAAAAAGVDLTSTLRFEAAARRRVQQSIQT